MPIQPPFLFLNEASVSSQGASAKYKISGQEFFLQGHFKDNPVMPASIMLEALGQLAVLFLLEGGAGEPGKVVNPQTIFFTSCEGVRCHRMCRPGDVLSLSIMEIAEADLDAATLRNVDVIVLANCGKLTVQQMGWLHGYAADGGGLLVFPGERVNPDVYNKQLFLIPGPLNGRLTAARLEAAEGDPAKVETFERLAVIDFAHPALSVFEEGEGRSLKGVRFYRRFPLKLPDPEKGSGVEKTNTVPFSTPDPFSGRHLAAGPVCFRSAGPGGEPLWRRPRDRGGISRQQPLDQPAPQDGLCAARAAPGQPRGATGGVDGTIGGAGRCCCRDFHRHQLVSGLWQGRRRQRPRHSPDF